MDSIKERQVDFFICVGGGRGRYNDVNRVPKEGSCRSELSWGKVQPLVKMLIEDPKLKAVVQSCRGESCSLWLRC